MKRSRYLMGLVFLLFLVLQACAPAPATTAAPTAAPTAVPTVAPTTEPVVEPATVKVVTLPFITFAPFYIALEEGFFAEQNLEVELVDMRIQEEILPALSSGQVDISSGLVSVGMFNAIARGGNFKITADKGYVDPEGCINWALAGRKELLEAGELASVEQLRGRTVNVVPATWLEFYMEEILKSGGLSLDDITTMNLGSAAVPDALNQGTLDAALNSEPWITRFIGAGHMPIFGLPQELMPESQAAVMMYGPSLLGENAEVGERFMVAYLQAVRQYNEGKTPRNLEIIAQFTQLDPAFLELMCWPAIREGGALNVESVVEFQEWAMGRGYLDQLVAPEQFWDGRFIQTAMQQLDSSP